MEKIVCNHKISTIDELIRLTQKKIRDLSEQPEENQTGIRELREDLDFLEEMRDTEIKKWAPNDMDNVEPAE